MTVARERVIIGWRPGERGASIVYAKGQAVENVIGHRGLCGAARALLGEGDTSPPERRGFWVLTFAPSETDDELHCRPTDCDWRRPTATELAAVVQGGWDELAQVWKEIPPATTALVVVDVARSVRLESGWRAEPRALRRVLTPALEDVGGATAPLVRLGQRWVGVVVSDGLQARGCDRVARVVCDRAHVEPGALARVPTWNQLLDAGEDFEDLDDR